MIRSTLLVLLLLSPPLHADSPRVADRFRVGGEGGWDLLSVDGDARRLYLTRGDHISVVAADDGHAIGEIRGTDGVHGIALAPKLKRGFASNGRSNSVTFFDTGTLATIQTIAIEGKNPDAIVFDAPSGRVVVFNGRSNDATLIDAASGKVRGTIALEGKPELAVSDGKGRVFVNLEDKSQVAVLDPAHGKRVAVFALEGCEEPTGLALDAGHRRLFAVCQNHTMVVLDAHSGKRVASVPIGDGPDGAEFDPERHLVYSSNGADGTLTVVRQVDADHYEVLASVPTQKSARTIVLDPKTHRLYLPAAEFGDTPAPTAEHPHPRPSVVPDSFVVLVVE